MNKSKHDTSTMSKSYDVDNLINDATQEELSQLRSWKEDIGLPALQQNQQLLIEIEQRKEENTALLMRLETYGLEVEKLKNEIKVLTEELDIAVTRSTTDLQDSSLRQKSLMHSEEALQAAEKRCSVLESESVSGKKLVATLAQKNTELTKQIEQYEIIVDKMQKDDISSNIKMQQETDKLKELQKKYDQLDRDYYAKQSAVTNLESEVSMLQNLSRNALHKMTDKPQEAKRVLEKEDHPTHRHNKTMRISQANTLRLRNMESEFSDDGPLLQDTDSTMRGSVVYNDHTNHYHYIIHEDDDTVRDFHEITPDPHTAQMKEQLQMEFDEILRKELTTLSEKYDAEIVEYKKQLMQQQQELMKKVTLNSVERIHHKHNPNNEPDSSQCKVFGWSLW